MLGCFQESASVRLQFRAPAPTGDPLVFLVSAVVLRPPVLNAFRVLGGLSYVLEQVHWNKVREWTTLQSAYIRIFL